VRLAISETKSGQPLAIFFLLLLFFLSSAFSIFLAQVGYFGALMVWCYCLFRKGPCIVEGTGFGLFFGLYMAAELVATLFAYNQAQSLLYMQRRMLLLPIAYLVLSNTSSRAVLISLFSALILSALSVALWGCRDLALHFPEYFRFERRMSEFQMYMTAGGMMMISCLMLLPFVLHKRTPSRIRWLASFILIPLGVNLLFTFTRSSWLGFIAGAVVIGVRRHKIVALPVIAAVGLVLLFASPEILDRMTSTFDPSHENNQTRLHMWRTGMRMFADHPVVGIGDIGTEQLWDRYGEPPWPPEGHLHNNLIMWLVTLGALGFCVLVGLFVRIWLRLWRIENSLKDDWLLGSLALGSLGVMAGFHINGLFEWNFGDAEIIMLVWGIVGLTLAAEKIGRKS